LADERTESLGEQWFTRLRGGDHRAFAELVARYHPMVFLCCRTLGLRESEAEDAASETFLAAYRGLAGFREEAKLSTWLWSIAYRRSVSFLRRRREHVSLSDRPEALAADGPASRPGAAMEQDELAERVWRAVEKLPPLWRVAVVLFYREEKGVAEIAEIMRTRENTIKTYLYRGRQRLKESLGALWEVHHANERI
jgi:RNA polymerase sigma-70 factor, ECF subfamily